LHSGELAYITKRFDRNKKDKIAVEDFCQLTENLTEHKYRGSIEKVAKTTQITTNKGLEVLRLFELVLVLLPHRQCRYALEKLCFIRKCFWRI
jgi:serine/threonine-protein kinase HipA